MRGPSSSGFDEALLPEVIENILSSLFRAELRGVDDDFSILRWLIRIVDPREVLDDQLSSEDPRAHLIKYEDIVARKAKVLQLFQEVGHLTINEIERVLSCRISGNIDYKPASVSKEDEDIINLKCKEVIGLVGYG